MKLRITSETSDQDRSMNEHTIKLLKEDLINVKQSLSECQRSEHMVKYYYFLLIRENETYRNEFF